MNGPRRTVIEAFARQLAEGIGYELEQNTPEQADMEAHAVRHVLRDGDEDAPETDRMTGFLLRKMHEHLEIHVRTPEDPGPKLDQLVQEARRAATADRTLGGILYGRETATDTDRPRWNMLEEGDTFLELYLADGADHGGMASLEFILQYATPPDDPARLVRLEEGDG